jgi:hypothetical protein
MWALDAARAALGWATTAMGRVTPAAWRIIGIVAGVMLVFWVGYGMGARNMRERINGAVTEAIIDRAADDAAAALEASEGIAEGERERDEVVREVIREVPVLIRDSRECDLPPEMIRRLNEVAR